MSKADEMFKELGFKKMSKKGIKEEFPHYDIVDCCYTKGKGCKQIWFSANRVWNIYGNSVKELQAINEKVKELGWNE